MATFKDMCDYMPAAPNTLPMKRAKIPFWKYSLILELTTPVNKDFDLWFWAYTAFFKLPHHYKDDYMCQFTDPMDVLT